MKYAITFFRNTNQLIFIYLINLLAVWAQNGAAVGCYGCLKIKFSKCAIYGVLIRRISPSKN